MIDSQIELMRIIKRNKKMEAKLNIQYRDGQMSRRAYMAEQKKVKIDIPFLLVKYQKPQNLPNANSDYPAGLNVNGSTVNVESFEEIDFYGEANVLKQLQNEPPTDSEIGNLFKKNINILSEIRKIMVHANEIKSKLKAKYEKHDSSFSFTQTDTFSDLPAYERHDSGAQTPEMREFLIDNNNSAIVK